MPKNEREGSDRNKSMEEVLQGFILDSDEQELRDAVRAGGEDPDELVRRGSDAVQESLRRFEARHKAEVENLHRGLGALVRLSRVKDGLTRRQLSERARVAEDEIHSIEEDPLFMPRPRTIVQLEKALNLPVRTLVVLSGAVAPRSEHFEEQVIRFAASAKEIGKLTRAEKQLLSQFVKFLAAETGEL